MIIQASKQRLSARSSYDGALHAPVARPAAGAGAGADAPGALIIIIIIII